MTFGRVRLRLRLWQTPTGRTVPQEIAMAVEVLSHAFFLSYMPLRTKILTCEDVLARWWKRRSVSRRERVAQAICHGGYIIQIRRLRTQMKVQESARRRSYRRAGATYTSRCCERHQGPYFALDTADWLFINNSMDGIACGACGSSGGGVRRVSGGRFYTSDVLRTK